MPTEKTKLYTNPARKNIAEDNVNNYSPQYKKLGIDPLKMLENSVPGTMLGARDRDDSFEDNPRIRKPSIRQENNSIPNVGNNIENSWSGVDGIIDDVSAQNIDINAPMIDNNYMDVDIGQKNVEFQSNTSVNLKSARNNEYILIVNENIISTGSLEEIQKEVNDLIFGEHKICIGEAIPVENILVFKNIKIKVGVFLE